MRPLWDRWRGTIAYLILAAALGLGIARVEDTRHDAAEDQRRNDIETCETVQAAVDALEGNRDVLLSFASDPTDPRVTKYRADTDAQIARARQDCSQLPRP